MRRKLLLFTIFYTLGVLYAIFILEAGAKKGIIILIFSLLTLFLCNGICKRIIIPFLLGIIFSFIFFSAVFFCPLNHKVDHIDEFSGLILSQDKDKAVFLLCSTSLPCSVQVPLNRDNLVGHRVKLRLVLERPKDGSKTEDFNMKNHLYSKGIFFTSKSCHILSASDKPVPFLILRNRCSRIKKGFLESLTKTTDETTGSMAEGLLFGNTSHMDQETLLQFRHNGTAHILAVSGLHIGIIYMVYRRLRKITGSSIISFIFVPLLLLYGLMSNWSPSVIRAISLVMLKLFSEIRNRCFDSLTALSLVILISLIINPFSILGIGFQMSFLAAFTLVSLMPFLKRKQPYIHEGIAVTLLLPVMLMPFMLLTFSKASLNGIVANPPIIFLAGIMVPLGILMLLIYTMVGTTPVAISLIFSSLCTFLQKINEFIAYLFPLCLDFTISALSSTIFYGFMFFSISETFFIMKKRKMHEICIFPLLIAICASAFLLLSIQ